MDQVTHQLPSVPMRYDEENAYKKLKGEKMFWICLSNVVVIVFVLLTVVAFLDLITGMFPPILGGLFLFYIGYLAVSFKVFGWITSLLDAPKLRDEGELTAYVTKMQRAELKVSFTVECSHTPKKQSKTPPDTSKPHAVVTHTSSHPFEYATSTDKSTLGRTWQQPAADGGEDRGLLGTGFVALVTSELKWFAAKGVTANKMRAEKDRLYEEHKDKDKECVLAISVVLPDQEEAQLYVPADANFQGRLPKIAEFFLIIFWLGAPLFFYYAKQLRYVIKHTVSKTIYSADHAPPSEGAACQVIEII